MGTEVPGLDGRGGGDHGWVGGSGAWHLASPSHLHAALVRQPCGTNKRNISSLSSPQRNPPTHLQAKPPQKLAPVLAPVIATTSAPPPPLPIEPRSALLQGWLPRAQNFTPRRVPYPASTSSTNLPRVFFVNRFSPPMPAA